MRHGHRLFAACGLAWVVGCGGHVAGPGSGSASGSGSGSGAGSGSEAGAGSAPGSDSGSFSGSATCITIAAQDFDTSCKTDVDCVERPPGGSSCGLSCDGGDEAYVCPTAAMNARAAEGYDAAWSDAIGYALGLSIPGEVCPSRPSAVVSCPPRGHAVCEAGTCTVARP